MTADEILALLHADPALARQVHDRLQVAEAWESDGPTEWHRHSLTPTGEVTAWGAEKPIARVLMGSDGAWRFGDRAFPSAPLARAEADRVLESAGWVLAGVDW